MTAPGINDHLAQARDNRAYAEWVFITAQSDPTALQWVVTAAFYSALHGLTAYPIGKGIVVKNHTARARASPILILGCRAVSRPRTECSKRRAEVAAMSFVPSHRKRCDGCWISSWRR